jgi:hypothetical protein
MVAVKSLTKLTDPRFNLEPGNKQTNNGRKEKLTQLLEAQKAVGQEINKPIESKPIETPVEIAKPVELIKPIKITEITGEKATE